MKNKLIYSLGILLIILSIGFYSCDKENSEQTNVPSSQLASKEGDEPLVIGAFDENDNFIFTVDKDTLLANWNYNLEELVDVDAQLDSLVVFKEDGNVFIQGIGTSWSSTIPLTYKLPSGGGIDGGFYGEGISCTSDFCSTSSTKCVPKPDKKSCTACDMYPTHCTKTVTARSIFDAHYTIADLLE